ncbi:MAG TPA: hypothetical protein VKU85_12440 [bacterium]|nr:hypothetical protein [bacterium]
MNGILRFLASDEAFALRRELAAPPATPEPDPLRLVTALRGRVSGELARALAEQVLLERRAFAKFPDPTLLLLERVALEQATSPAIATFHAAALPRGARVVDLGCGLGADARAFARAGHAVVAVDRDPARAFLARHNLEVAFAEGAAGALVVAGDATALPARGDVLFADPDRRRGRGRTFALRDTSPDAATIRGLLPRFARALVKAPPAIPDEDVPRDASVDFLSEGGECREALLRFGEGAEPGRVRAVLAATGETRTVPPGPRARVASPGAFLLDPDPALRRAGGVDGLAEELDAGRVAPDVTYLFAAAAPRTPWARAYRVLEVFAYRKRDLDRRLAADPPRELVVKQRGAGIAEADVRRGVPRSADGPARTVILWPDGARRLACLAEVVDPR